jgi:hypothetical protein
MDATIYKDIHIEPAQAGTYFVIPFQVSENIERLEIEYSYTRRLEQQSSNLRDHFSPTPEINIIDIGLIAPDGSQVGASGSDKTRFYVSESAATPGYKARSINEGDWQIIVGAYKVAPEGVDVHYAINMVEKSLRLLKGDLHVHTVASDGVHTMEELILKAKANGLDFLAFTDHNQTISADALPHNTGVTLIPGVEWTHYRGHANFLGVDKPYDDPFFADAEEVALQKFITARQRGALAIVNHPYEGSSSFQFDLKSLPFDCLEVWNGPMRESNLRAVGLWQQMLMSGLRIPICGGSDYHRDTPFIFLGGPTMCLYAMSNGTSDILAALRQGHGYLSFAPFGPQLEMTAGESMMGDEVDWETCREIEIKVRGLLAGDEVRVITHAGSEALHKAETDGLINTTYKVPRPGFARVEVARSFLPGLPMLPALLSNPIYFKG